MRDKEELLSSQNNGEKGQRNLLQRGIVARAAQSAKKLASTIFVKAYLTEALALSNMP